MILCMVMIIKNQIKRKIILAHLLICVKIMREFYMVNALMVHKA